MRWPHRVGVAVAVVLGVAASAAPLLAGTSASRSGQGDTVTAVQGPVRADAGARPGRGPDGLAAPRGAIVNPGEQPASAVGARDPLAGAGTSLTAPSSGGAVQPVVLADRMTAPPVRGTLAPRVATTSRGYYVSCHGSDGGSGSKTSPWRTLRRASQYVFAAGTGLYLRRGCTWSERLDMRGNGTATAPVVLGVYGRGTTPTISHAGDRGWAPLVLGSPFTQATGIAVTDAPGVCVQLNGRRSLLTGVFLARCGIGVQVTGNGSMISNVSARDLHMVVNTPAWDDDYGAVGFVVEAADVTVRASRCTNCRAPSTDYGYDGGFVEIWNKGDRLRVADNVAVNTQGFLEIGGNASWASAVDLTITRNKMTNIHGGLWVHTSGTFGMKVARLRFTYNRIYNTTPSRDPVFGGDMSVMTLTGNRVIANQPVATGAPAVHVGNVYYANYLGFRPHSTELVASYARRPSS